MAIIMIVEFYPALVRPSRRRAHGFFVCWVVTKNKIRRVEPLMLKPLGDRIVVKTLEAETTSAGGIVLPDSAKEKPQQAEVLAVGPGKVMDNGKQVAPDVKVGDKVVYSKYGGTEIKVSGEEYVILRADDILGVL